MHSQIFKVSGSATLAVASIFAPMFDLEGRQINTLHLHTDPAVVALTILPANGGAYVIFTYHRRHAARLETFFNQLKALKENDLKQILSKMVLMYCENTVLAPRFIDGLLIEQRSELEQIFGKTVFAVEMPQYNELPNVLLF